MWPCLNRHRKSCANRRSSPSALSLLHSSSSTYVSAFDNCSRLSSKSHTSCCGAKPCLRRPGRPAVKRELVLKLQDGYRVSERRAVKVVGAHRSGIRYRPKRPMYDAPICKRIEEIAAVRIRYGYRRIHILLQREGWHVNLKRVYRIYCLAGLNLRRE